MFYFAPVTNDIDDENEQTVHLSSNLSKLRSQFNSISWSNFRKATMDVYAAVFGRAVLSSHSLTGLPSNVMLSKGKRVKPKLEPSKVTVGKYVQLLYLI